MASFIKTQRGSEKLIFEGYSYNISRRGKDGKAYWRCDEGKLKCKASAVTNPQEDIVKVKIGNSHNHEPSPTKICIKTLQNNIKDAAVDKTDNTPRDIVNAAMEGISDFVKTNLPELKNLQKTVYRKRKSVGIGFVGTHSLMNLKIPNELCNTLTERQENVILADSGEGDPNRIIILGCDTDLNRLITCDTWLIDGTFKSPAELRYHIWVIYGLYHEKTIPFLYVFLPNKKQNTYETAIEMIFDKIDTTCPTRPKRVFIDLEAASKNAFKNLIPEVEISGCFYHFSQSLWRKIKELQLVKVYKTDEYFRTIIKSLAALAFLPYEEVLSTFESLADELTENFGETQSNHGLIDHFIVNFVGRRLPKRTPLFPIETWNCCKTILENLPHQANSVESWHCAFSSIFITHYLNPFNLIEGLLKEQVRADYICQRLEAGQPVKEYSNLSHENANDKLLKVIQDFENRTIEDFLSDCSQFVKFTKGKW